MAKDQLETLKIITSYLSDNEKLHEDEYAQQVVSGLKQNYMNDEKPTRDDDDAEGIAVYPNRDAVPSASDSRKYSALGLLAASQLACVSNSLKANRFRTAEEIANWDMESLSRMSNFNCSGTKFIAIIVIVCLFCLNFPLDQFALFF